MTEGSGETAEGSCWKFYGSQSGSGDSGGTGGNDDDDFETGA